MTEGFPYLELSTESANCSIRGIACSLNACPVPDLRMFGLGSTDQRGAADAAQGRRDLRRSRAARNVLEILDKVPSPSRQSSWLSLLVHIWHRGNSQFWAFSSCRFTFDCSEGFPFINECTNSTNRSQIIICRHAVVIKFASVQDIHPKCKLTARITPHLLQMYNSRKP